MKKLISAILILSMLFTLGITSMTASAKYVEKTTTTWEEVSCFDFDTYSDQKIDYTKYENVFHYFASGINLSTTHFANSGGNLYTAVCSGADQKFGKYKVKDNISKVGLGSVAFKLANVIDNSKFVEGETYKVVFDYKPEGYTYAPNGSTTSTEYYAVGETATENVPFTISDLDGLNMKTPAAYLIDNVTGYTDVSGAGVANEVKNGEWATAQTKEFKATADKHIGTVSVTNSTYSMKTPTDVLKASSVRFNVPRATATVKGTAYTIIPTSFSVDNVKILKKVTKTERIDETEGTYTKTFDGSSLTDVSSCGEGATNAVLVTDKGHSDNTSIKEALSDTKEYVGAGLRFQKLFGDLAPVNEDIGKVFEVSAWIYPEKTEGIPEDSTGTYIEMAMASPYASTNAWTSRYRNAAFYVPWNEWTQIKIYHKVANDCSMDNNNADGKGHNGRCDAVRIQSADCVTDGNIVKTFYIDDVTVREIPADEVTVETTTRPEVTQTLHKAEDGRQDALYSEIVITPGDNINVNKMYTYMLPTTLIESNIKNELAKSDKKAISLPKINGDGTVTIFSILKGIPSTDIEITSKVVYTLDAPYIYGIQSAGTYYSEVSDTVENLNK